MSVKVLTEALFRIGPDYTLVDLNTSNNILTLKEYIYCIYGTENRKEEPFSTHEHKQSLRTLFVPLSLQMIQV